MLLTVQQFLAFLAAALLITASPGPDNLMVLSTGIARGRGHGVAFGLGCALGCISHTALAALGVSALIAASPLAFMLLKVCGGLYLVWMGVQALRSRGAVKLAGARAGDETLLRLFARGALANAINPKVALFFLSFLPQFVIADNGHVGAQTVLLGLIFTLQAALMFGLLGYFSGVIGNWLQRHGRAGVWLDRIAGTIFVALGLRLIASR